VIALLALHGVVGFAAIAADRRLGQRALLVGAVAPAVAFAWVVAHLGGVLDGRPVVEEAPWVPSLDLTLSLRLDGFGALLALLVTGIGVLVLAYAHHYFGRNSPNAGRLAGLLVLFAGAMLGLVLADNLLLLYGFWELTSVTSYLLIGNEHGRATSRAAALQALLITGAGGLAMLGGFALVGNAAGTFRLSAILVDPPTGTVVTAGLLLVVVGALTKSAQYPFHSWLPGAMVAPTPVSAYLHSATMVKAGIYLLARFAPVVAAVTPGWRPLVLGAGLVTMVAGGLRALRQHDLKLLLAHGTVSQLGFLVVLLGAGTPATTAAGCALLLAHAAFKASLFMVVGAIDQAAGGRDLRTIPVLGRGWGPTTVVAVIAAASMAGIPLAFGFVAKESAIEALGVGAFTGATLVLVTVVAASAVTAAYSVRFVWGAFVAPRRRAVADGAVAPDGAEGPVGPGAALVAPAAVLAVLSAALGLVPGLADGVLGAAAASLDPGVERVELALWHGLNEALALSAVALVGGALLFAGARRIEPMLALGERVPSGASVYLAGLRGLNAVADRVTGVVQNGTLPVYVGVILLTAAVAPGVALLGGDAWPGWPQAVDSAVQVPIAVLLVGAALAAAAVRHRFSAAIFLGVVGYAMAGLFVVQGAPDLALTQVAIETLSTVLFVLVLRRLPHRFERRGSRGGRAARLAISAIVGAAVFVFAIVAGGNRTAAPVSDEMVARSLPDAEGRNVVNVILVDFRGFDTLGEITVLAVAAIGAVALARAGRRPRQPAATPDPESAESTPALAGEAAP
jgi:multicomponent Na+:H+ antiporter subunit A